MNRILGCLAATAVVWCVSSCGTNAPTNSDRAATQPAGRAQGPSEGGARIAQRNKMTNSSFPANYPTSVPATGPTTGPARNLVGKKYPVEIQKVVDPQTGARVTRYVHAAGKDTVFYYSSPYITPDGKKVVFSSTVSGRGEIHSINIADNEPFSVQLTQGCTSLGDRPCVDTERNLVFYYCGRSVMQTNIDTLEATSIYEIPE